MLPICEWEYFLVFRTIDFIDRGSGGFLLSNSLTVVILLKTPTGFRTIDYSTEGKMEEGE